MAARVEQVRRIIRPALSVLDKVAPAMATSVLERIWCTVPRSSPASPDVPGHRFTVNVGRHAVVAESWGSGPAVYLVHGWGSRRAHLGQFVAPLVAAGRSVIAYDALGHGDSQPGMLGAGRGLLSEFCDCLHAVVASSGPASAVIGHSLGATATALAVLDGLATDKVVLVSPMADLMPYVAVFADQWGFSASTRDAMLCRIERRVGRPMTDFQVPQRVRAAHLRLPPALVVHDGVDREIQIADGRAITSIWPAARFEATHGLGHRRILRDPAVIELITHYLTDGTTQGGPKAPADQGRAPYASGRAPD